MRADVWAKYMFIPDIEPRDINPPSVMNAVCSKPSMACRHISV